MKTFVVEKNDRADTAVRRWIFILLISVGCFGGVARASPITYQLYGVGTGSLGGTNFTNAAFSLTGAGDTSNVSNVGTGQFQNGLQSVTINISGLSQVGTVDHFYFYVNQSIAGAGYVDVFTGDVLDFNAPAFNSYSGTVNLSSVPVTSSFLAPFSTSGGVLNLSSVSSLTFIAAPPTAVPALPQWALVLFAAILATIASRKAARNRRLSLAAHAH